MDEKSRISASIEAIKNSQTPYNEGEMRTFDAYGCIDGNCGDTMEIFLAIEKNVVVDATYKSDGCAFSHLCASIAAGLSVGKPLVELPKISGALILGIMSNYPREEEHCAFLAAATLREAFGTYQNSEQLV